MYILIKWLVCNISVYWRAEEELSYVHSVHRFLDAMRCTIALVTDGSPHLYPVYSSDLEISLTFSGKSRHPS